MEKMSYKTFVWPQNPHFYHEETSREAVYEKNEAGEDVFKGLGLMKRTITAEGVFFGEGASSQYQKLEKLFEITEPGDLEHPVWGIRYCYLTGLELTQEPKENCVAYKAVFQQAMANGSLPK